MKKKKKFKARFNNTRHTRPNGLEVNAAMWSVMFVFPWIEILHWGSCILLGTGNNLFKKKDIRSEWK